MKQYLAKKYFSTLAVFALIVMCSIRAFAIENDYKNNLLKIDINKSGADSYKIELFTQKPYGEPIRVIKKSDTRYYIFLPETSHSITSTAAVGDVKNVDVELHPYPGQDLNNGYTRINITTDKPLTFSTSIKTSGSTVANKIDQQKLAQLDSVFDQQNKKIAQKPVVVPETRIQNTDNIQKQTAKTYPAQQPAEVKTVSKSTPRPGMKTIVVDTSERVQTKNSNVEEKIPAMTGKTSTKLEEITDTDLTTDDSKALEQAAKEQGLTEIATGEQEAIPELTKIDQVKLAVKKVYHLTVNNIWVITSILLFIAALLLLKSSKKKCKSQDGMDKILTPTGLNGLSSLNAVQQATEPTLVTYESPSTSKTYSYELYEVGEKPQSSTFSELTSEPKKASIETAGAIQTAVETAEDEASVLATSTISDNRGFCLVNFEGSVSLIGFIGEEIFVLHNFGNIGVFNPTIQYRLAEKNENEAFYIVKTADTKLMAKVTADSMSLEMVM